MSTLEVKGTTTSSPSAPPQPRNLAGWKARGLHTITLESGEVVKVRIPDLSAMLALGQIPEQLRQAALLQAFKDEGDPPLALQKAEDGSPILSQELVKDFYDLRAHVIAATVVEPELTTADVEEVPVEDRDLIYAIAMRERDTDARGVRLGVEPLSRWATFREKHGCAPDCKECEAAVGQLSTVDVGLV